MTIAISIKVYDGLVLAADSASTLYGSGASSGIVNVYNTADKVFNLYKGLPIGGTSWGTGSIGHASISTLAKDLRRRLMGRDPRQKEWAIDPGHYSLEEVAEAARRFLYDELYAPIFKDAAQKPALGFLVAGYSAGGEMAEEWRILIQGGECRGPELIREPGETGLSWQGEPEAITRLVMGYGTRLPEVLKELGVPEDQIVQAMRQIESRLEVRLAPSPMPIQDAIDLAKFLVQLTIMFSRFGPGAPTVGGPIEVAAITRHEGFKWVRRNLYYNPEYSSIEE